MKIKKNHFVDKSRKLFKVFGKDSKKFLQGIITNDIKSSFSSIIYSSLLTPQGKYLFDFFIYGIDDENFIIDIDIDSHHEFINRLNLYKLRSDVVFLDINASVILSFGNRIEGSYYDPRNKKLGWRKITFEKLENNNPQEELKFFKNYESKRIDLCIPKSGYELKSHETYILEVRFDKINGISFSKGCFVGQEVTARMRHKTKLKNGLIKLENIPSTPKTDLKITNEKGQLVGHITSLLDSKGLAIIKFMYAKGKLYCEGSELKI